MSEDSRDEGDVARGLRQIGRSVVPVADPGELAARRDRTVPHLEAFARRTFEAEHRRGQRARVLVVVSGLAAAAAVALVSARLLRGHPAGPSIRAMSGAVSLVRSGAPDAINRVPLELATNDHVHTGQGSAEVELGSGAVVALEPDSDLSLESSAAPGAALIDERVVLGAGTVRVKVPKLPPGSRFVVATPSATVTVHGTAFVVTVSNGKGGEPVTRVSVTEGHVSVGSAGREIMLDPGGSWSSDAAIPLAPTPRSPAEPTPAPVAPSGSSVPQSAQSTLPAENALFREALLERAHGNPKRAVSLLSDLLHRYPTSPLAGEAHAELDRAKLDMARPPAASSGK